MEENNFSEDELNEFQNNDEYSKDYSDESLLKKLKKNFSKAGVSVVYGALFALLFIKGSKCSNES